ncbi:hypothetical protein DFH11DRAFT_1611589 [Phellopilus nigrolimitatus]|nr:hypothetical protein DFH11DRAFT_1611589 [Phellopilus nigrolimitatus]
MVASSVSACNLIHPSYCSKDADLIIVSQDGVQFRVHSAIMKIASGFFRDMLALPQAAISSQLELIHLHESQEILKDLLDIIYPDGDLPDESVQGRLYDLCVVAEKYDMHGVLRRIRKMVFTNASTIVPLEKYALASRLGWEDEITTSLIETLRAPISGADALPYLRKLDTQNILRLQELHRKRKQGFLCLLESAEWLVFKFELSEEMDKCSYGESIDASKFWSRPSFAALWSYRCSQCGNPLLFKTNVKNSIKLLFNRLPKS